MRLTFTKLIIFGAILFTFGFAVSLLFPKETHAIDLPNEGYGFSTCCTFANGPANKFRVITYDAATQTPIQMDSMGLIWSSSDPAEAGNSQLYFCSGNCPVNGIYEFTGFNDSVIPYLWNISAQYFSKAGYHFLRGGGGYSSQFPAFNVGGEREVTMHVYLTRDADLPQYRIDFPRIGEWYSFDPTFTLWVNPHPTLMGSNEIRAFITAIHATTFQAYSMNTATSGSGIQPPFPKNHTFPPQGLPDGMYQMGGSFGQGLLPLNARNSGRSDFNGTRFGKDTVTPTVSCNASENGSEITLNLISSDALSGLAEGDVDVRTSIDGGNNWTSWGNNGLPSGGNLLNGSYQITQVPGTSYEIRFRARDHSLDSSGTPNHWSGFETCASFIVPALGFEVQLIPDTQTVNQGDPASYTVSLTAVGSFSGTVTLTHNNNDSDLLNDQPTLTNMLLGGGGAVDLPDGTGDILSMETSLATAVGTYIITVTGTSGGITRSDSAELVVALALPKPWLKTNGGDVGSNGGISMESLPPAGEANASHLILASGVTNFNSAKNWLLGSYGNISEPPGGSLYQPLFAKQANVQNFSDSNLDGLPSGVSRKSGNLTHSSVGTTFSGGTAVLFVEGSLAFTQNFAINNGSSIVFVVSGNVTFDPTVTSVDGLFIFDGTFSDGASADVLTLKGSLIGASTSSFNFARELVSDTGPVDGIADNPSEVINFQPQYLWFMRDLLGGSRIDYTEINP